MSRRNLITKYKVWNDLDSAAAVSSEKTVVDQLDIVKYIISIEPTVNCIIKVEFCDDKNSQTETWKELDFNTPIILNGAVDTEYTLQIKEFSSYKMRLNFVSNSGTGLVNAWIAGNNIGA